MRFILTLLGLTVVSLAAAQPSPKEIIAAYAQRTLVLYNNTLPKSQELAEYYAKQRGIPAVNLIGLKCSEAETITRADFNSTINEPLRNHFTEKGWWKLETRPEGKMCTQVVHRIFAIMQGIPLRIDEQPEYGPADPKTKQKPVIPPPLGRSNAASVDSELMVFGLVEHPIAGAMNNAYFDKTVPFLTQPLAPFFLVGRIDGPTYEDAQRLIDDAIEVEQAGLYGKTYIDLAQKNEAGYKQGEDWLLASARTLGASGFPVLVDTRAERFPLNYPMRDCAIYLGWYTLPPDGPFLNPNFRFKKGAIACHLHSFSATTVRRTNEGWVGLFLSQGASGVFGNVYEPFLGLTVHFDKLTDRLLRGFTLAEANSMATPGVSWMTVVVGDPLYRPFAANIDKGTSDLDYRTLRKVLRDHPPTADGNEDLMKVLEKAAAEQKSGTLYEALAQICQGSTPTDLSRITKFYKSATTNYAHPADKIRIVLQRVDLLLLGGQNDAAVNLLKSELPTYAKAPEVTAMEVRLTELQPKAKK